METSSLKEAKLVCIFGVIGSSHLSPSLKALKFGQSTKLDDRFPKHTWKLQPRRRQQTTTKTNLSDCTVKLEEAFTKFPKVVITNHKSAEAVIKSMETQIGQLAKQLQTSSIGFSASTEENPNGH
ncbi:hypothetical protein JHK85_010634 [Glycine max]|nr:hypothetical protein JHK85_010634 [Glycine max]